MRSVSGIADVLGQVGERGQLLMGGLELRVGRKRGDLVHAGHRRQ